MSERQDDVENPLEVDVLIAGAGMAGVLAATRLAQSFPEARLALLDKSPEVGGRLRSSHRVASEWNSGLAAISAELYDYIDNSLKADPEAGSLADCITRRHERVGVLIGSGIEMLRPQDLFTAHAAKALGGGAAAREWGKVDEVLALDHAASDQAFSKAWKHPRKSPAAVVLSHFAILGGITDIWTSHPLSLQERIPYLRQGLSFGSWEDVLASLLARPLAAGNLSLVTSCRMVESLWEDKFWHVQTEQGRIRARALVVAQPPWQAMEWLDRRQCPVPVLNLGLKAKPTSAVTLNEKLIKPEAIDELPDLCLIPAEQVTAINSHDGSLCLQALIDYELSLDAPSVVKAIKRLRRASRKLQKVFPAAATEGEYLALRSIAWSQSTAALDRKNWERLSDPSKVQREFLAFCGDAYGSSYQPDENLVKSVTSACSLVGSLLEKKGS